MILRITKKASKKISKLETSISKQISIEILKLSQNPYSSQSKKLQSTENKYRIRIGSFRVIYKIDTQNKIISILRVADRKDIYRG
ncbi:hypothetical protein A3D77_03595 [Candidatus Gottesmanbacteria bacterium RIFCSPHIGHO2_02_FULL_39_11]|uniref:Plasmid stabilization protein n=1 Tax=Candidatus Gottesmanbacteria bacterium RIFCSPHIGHO2_02_FULL_39_11 TaxID=1798382 RepID=A0A1F5ZN90_9BACT|nr:MAG: hypothetical protein A3D77_03595 [Candidatus Gottesmanbacteria bacterium RIFCSPHIGHO2_02_FULL_39_11]